MKKNILLIVGIILITACQKKKDELETSIAALNTDIEIERFDVLFGNATKTNLAELKKTYPFMFSRRFSDSLWLDKIKDTIHQELVEEVQAKYKTTDALEIELEQFFNHLKYYYSQFTPPRVITTTTMVDYRNRVIVTDTIALLGLDNYLGEDHHFYQGIQQFIRKDFNSEQIAVDFAGAYAERYIRQAQRKTFLDEMIYHGKQLYFKALMLPQKTEAQIMGYTTEELEWVKANEHYIWRYFVEKELLFDTDTKLLSRFINPAPFSKFYLAEIDGDSPGRIGQYIGWQIVKAYMTHHTVDLANMLQTEPKAIFDTSKFKPRK